MARTAKPHQLDLMMPLSQVADLHAEVEGLQQALRYAQHDLATAEAALKTAQDALVAERLRSAELALIVQKYPYLLTENNGLRLENTRLLDLIGALTTARIVRPSTDLHGLLTELLKLCHPDKWSQGQAAHELAHEVSVRVMALRQEVEHG